MSFNPVEYLRQGKVDFVFELTMYDRDSLIKRIRTASDRIEIINGFLDISKDRYPYFCFAIIYDIDEFKEDVFYLMDKYTGLSNLDLEKLKNVLYHTNWGKDYVLDNLDSIIMENEEKYKVILEYIFNHFEENRPFVDKLYLHKNLHVRFLFMKYLVTKRTNQVDQVYDDIMKYLTSYTHQPFEQITFLPELMDKRDISELAACFLENSKDKTIFTQLKKYILETYKENDLGEILLGEKKDEDTFSNDADSLFLTSYNYQYTIFRNYPHLISANILEDFESRVKHFKKDGRYDSTLSNIYYYGLGKKLEKYVDKYLSLSKNQTTEYILDGSTCSSYRIGDFIFKLNRMKWSYEDVICPNLYLILKNLEEDFVRDEDGKVQVGIEVQKYLSKSARNLPGEVYDFFRKELGRLGYRTTDSLIEGNRGDNCMLLDSYKDADCSNPELLPDLFKQYPMVLVDRDRVYKKEKETIKQIPERWWDC